MDLKAEFSRMPFEVLFNTLLAPYTSLHIGGQADFLAFPENEKDLLYLLKFSKNLNLPVTILGGGANTLILDGGVRGLVISLSKNLKLFGYNTFIWSCVKFFNKQQTICSIIKFREKYFLKEFDKNLNSNSFIKVITENEILKKYDKKFKVIAKNAAKNFNNKILELNNLNIVDLDHNDLEFLQLKGLLDKDLIKPLYLS